MSQEERIFDFPKVEANHDFGFLVPHKEMVFDTPNDGKIHGVLFYSKQEQPKGLIFYFHGKGSNVGASKWKAVVDRYTGLGFDFFMVDYRGAGKSRGPFTEENMLEDCDVVYKSLMKTYPEEAITVYGKSLGTSFATYVASKNNPRTLIIEAPFYNLHDVAASTVPHLPKAVIELIVKYPLRTDAWLRDVNCPVFILHGTADTIIPHSSSERLHQLIAGRVPTDLTIIEGGDHDHLYQHDIFNRKIEEALGLLDQPGSEDPVAQATGSEA